MEAVRSFGLRFLHILKTSRCTGSSSSGNGFALFFVASITM